MTTLFESLKKKMTSKRTGIVEQFKALRAAIADGKKVDLDAATELLNELGKTPDDLAAEVDTLKERRAQLEVLKASQKAEQEYPGILEEIENGEVGLEALVKKHEEKMAPVHHRKAQCFESMRHGDNAKRFLVDTATDPELLQAIEGINEQMVTLEEQKSEAGRRLKDRKDWLVAVQSRGDSAASSDREQLDEMRAGLAPLQAEYDAFHEQAEELNRRYSDAQQALLDPNAI